MKQIIWLTGSIIACGVISACSSSASEIHVAAAKGDLEKVTEIVAANPSATNERCTDEQDQNGWVRIGYPFSSKVGWMPLHYAANEGRTSVIGYLLQHGADVNCVDGPNEFDVTPLHCAAAQGKLDAVKLLIGKGCCFQ